MNEPDNKSGARKEIFAYGLRNPSRFGFDRKTGDLWAGDVSQILWRRLTSSPRAAITVGASTKAHRYKPGPDGA
jgi:hypothetical protein